MFRADREEIDALLADWGQPWKIHGVRLPSTEDVKAVLVRAPGTAPGPDGIPYKVWLSCVDGAATTPHEVLCAFAGGEPAPFGFNDAWLCMLPKGRSPQDVEGAATRTAKALRPLSLKNTDGKSIAATTARTMKRTVSKAVSGAQRGFAGGRQLTTCIVEMDAYTRLFRTTMPDSDCPVTCT